MRVLVTGGLGFIGAWTARVLLEGGHAVRVFDLHADRVLFDQLVGPRSGEVELTQGDITDAEAVSRAVAGCEGVVHLAAVLLPVARQNPLLGARINVLGTLHVFEAAKQHGVRGVAYASSAAVFGPDDGIHPEPRTQYGAYKLCNEGNARAYWEDAGIRSIGLRPSTVYGPGRSQGLTADPTLAMRAAAEGTPFTIRFTGSTGMDYARDVGTIFARSATETPDGALAFSLQGQLASMVDVLHAIKTVVPDAQVDAEGPELMFAAQVDESPLHRALPDLARTSLLEGTRETIAFYRR
ncbi:MAG TPA: NAD(P)-dependent oxidoreductase [Candidatus Sulfotelmatobacter sp.]|nr:NAD(P)-dependent oxidoreductase [Candidatus Sulfotelmatobacter sp.]